MKGRSNHRHKVHFSHGDIRSLCGTEYYIRYKDEFLCTTEMHEVTCGNCVRKMRMYKFKKKEGFEDVCI